MSTINGPEAQSAVLKVNVKEIRPQTRTISIQMVLDTAQEDPAARTVAEMAGSERES